MECELEIKQHKIKIEQAVKSIEALQSQVKYYEEIADSIDENLKQFELTKLQKLNELDIFVCLSASQLE